MSKISRVTQLIFGSGAGSDQLGVFGSLAAGSPAYTTDPSPTSGGIQSLSNYLTGWFGAIVGANSPAIQDMNSICFLYAYQLAYLFQAGVPEWDSATIYYQGSFCQVSGVIYVSQTNANTGNAPASSPSDWRLKDAPTIQKFTSGSGTYTTPSGVSYLRVRMAGGGGSGAGGGTSGSPTAGANGNNTTFGTTLLVAGGGSAGALASNSLGPVGGEGGSASLGSGPVGYALVGTSGGSGLYGSIATVNYLGGYGGSTPYFGGGGAPLTVASGGPSLGGNVNSGGGGSGGASTSTDQGGGGGGGSGGYVEAIIYKPSATYAYAVGASVSGGTGGTHGINGGLGAAGVIYVEEFY